MTKQLLKKIWKHSSTVFLVIIVLILLVPAWRVPFQGWVQGIFMADLAFEKTESRAIPAEVETWNLQHTGGQKFQLRHFLTRPLIISFWATWCPPCRAELKELKLLKDNYQNSIHFLSISEEPLETIKKSGLDGQYDFLYSTNRIPSFFNVNAYPTLCIIDKTGHLIFQHSGAGGLENEKNEAFLNGLIENQ